MPFGAMKTRRVVEIFWSPMTALLPFSTFYDWEHSKQVSKVPHEKGSCLLQGSSVLGFILGSMDPKKLRKTT